MPEGGTDRKVCPECGHDPVLFDPRCHPEPDRYLCPACDHEWRERSVDTDTEKHGENDE